MQRVPLNVLAEDPRNARKIDDAALAGLGASVETFGDLSGVVFNTRTGELVAGHQRVKALRAAGATEWVRDKDRAWIEHPKTGERFGVRLVDWDETTQRLANLAANNPHIQGEFTEDVVAQLREIEDHAAFEAARLDELLKEMEGDVPPTEPGGGLTDPDAPAEPPAEPITKRGDVWVLGEHRLMCGDSTIAADVRCLLGAETAAMMATDPPYGVNFTDAEGKNIAADMDYSVIPGFFGVAVDVLKPGRAILCFGAETNQGLYSALFGRELRMRPRLLFWKKPSFVLRRHDYHSQYECIFYGWTPGGDAHTRWHGDRAQSDVWEVKYDVAHVEKVHPTQKPVELFEIAMQNHTREGEICYEPFSGSGSQIIAGERLGRRVFAMELEPRWVDAAVARWEAFTGRQAVRAG